MREIQFYTRNNDRCPATEFINKLNKKEELPFVERMIEKLSKYGNTLGRPYVGYLGDKIYELIISTRYGEIRLLYFFDDEKIIITNGFRKKTRKTPPGEIKKAILYREDFLDRGN